MRGGQPVRREALPIWPLPLSPEDRGAVAELLGGGSADDIRERVRRMEHKRAFEAAFAELCGTAHAVAVSTGTTALDLAIDALDLAEAGVVVAADYGHPSTVRQAARRHRLRLVDVEPETLCLSPRAVARALDAGDVRCVITTHLAGDLGAVAAIEEMCARAGVPLIEDASHAHGARGEGRCAGAFGAFGCFSLHETKNLPVGEGGILTVRDEKLFEALWRGHDIGRDPGAAPYDFVALGGNHRLGEIASLIGRIRLRELDAQCETRMAAATRLRALAPADGPLHFAAPGPGTTRHGYHFVPARYRPEHCGNLSRKRFILAMCAEGIPCNPGWPSRLSDIPAIRAHAEPADTPVAASALAETVWFDQRLLLVEGGPEQILQAAAKIQAHFSQRARAS